jgi:DNA-binding NarL/FixJ family response regulator
VTTVSPGPTGRVGSLDSERLFDVSYGHPVLVGVELVTEPRPRQLEILELLAQGRANADIAERLHLSQQTVRNQVSTIFDQLGVRSRGQAIVLAREAGFGRK